MIPFAVGDLLLIGERAELEGDDQLVRLLVPVDLLHAGQEEPLVALDVVLLDVGGCQFEVDRSSSGVLPGIIVEMLGGLDVVLVVVGPMEIDFFAVVGDGVFLALGIAALRDEVAVLVVAAEEGVQVVEDGGFKRLAAATTGGLVLQVEVLLAQRRAVVRSRRGCRRHPRTSLAKRLGNLLVRSRSSSAAACDWSARAPRSNSSEMALGRSVEMKFSITSRL
ncbi:MAG: hypothetical protein U5N86_12135 [Planctomycetota bacterium]|nr:hypothetical protein [Planctomycetota bacterium]